MPDIRTYFPQDQQPPSEVSTIRGQSLGIRSFCNRANIGLGKPAAPRSSRKRRCAAYVAATVAKLSVMAPRQTIAMQSTAGLITAAGRSRRR